MKTKKLVGLLFALIITACVFSVNTFAASVTYDGLTVTTAVLSDVFYVGNVLTISDVHSDSIDVEISMEEGAESTAVRIMVTETNVNITLNNVNIDLSGISNGTPLTFDNGGSATNATITLVGTNTLKSANYSAGIDITDDSSDDSSTVTIKGDGTLNTTGGVMGEGISVPDGGTVIIDSGTINATGGSDAAGIGAGFSGRSDTRYITVNGGSINATGGTDAAGIKATVTIASNMKYATSASKFTGSETYSWGTGTATDGFSADRYVKINLPVENPVISPNSAKFTTSQSVTITTPTTGASIYYTTNGDTPTTGSTFYNDAITITDTTTIKAIAIKDGMANSDVVSVTLNKNTAAVSNNLIAFGDSIPAGVALTDPNTQNFVALMGGAKEGTAFINYGISGQTSAELKVKMVDNNAYQTEIASADAITISIGGNDLMDVFYGLVGAKLSPAIPAQEVAEIMANNSDSRYSDALTAAIIIINTGYDAVKNDFEVRNTQVKENIQAMITHIKNTNSDVNIYVTNQYNPYKDVVITTFGNINIGTFFESGLTAAGVGLNAQIASLTGCTVVDIYSVFDDSATKVINANADPLNLDFHPNADGHQLYANTLSKTIWIENPVINPNGANFDGTQSVTISTPTTGAKIYYTTNGDTPTTGSTLYNDAITITDTATIKAIAIKDGMLNSEVVSATFTENTYTISVTGGSADATTATKGTSVTITATEPIGRSFTSWTLTGTTVTDSTKNPLTFEMPGNAVTATANFKDVSSTVTGVTVSPNVTTVQKGKTQQFIASVQGQNSPPQTVNWTVEGNVDNSTSISANGLLTIAAGETAKSITVKATSTVNNTIFGTASVSVSDTAVATYTVTPNAGANGSISPNAVQNVNSGGSVIFNFQPNTDYEVDTVTVNNVLVTPTTPTSHTISNITKNTSISVTFKAISSNSKIHSIIIGLGQNGQKGQNMQFASDAEYSNLESVKVDGKKITKGTHFTAIEGSTIITLLSSYTNTLATGEHTLEIISTTGTATTHFTISETSTTNTTNTTPAQYDPTIAPLTGIIKPTSNGLYTALIIILTLVLALATAILVRFCKKTQKSVR